ncbi:MAG: anaerobic sulfatase maturase [Candidatus Hodarchaeota archaeon]
MTLKEEVATRIPTWPGFHVMIKPRGAICNLGCEYCFYLPKMNLYQGSKFHMSEDVLESFTKQYIEAQKVLEVTFGWQGGEPLLMGLDFFKKAVEFQEKYKKPGMKIINALQTNGTLLNDEWGRFLHDKNFLIGISIDGPPALHDKYRLDKKGNPTFKKVRAGFNALKRNKVEFNILCCVNATNADHPLKVYKYFRDVLKTEFIQFIPIVERESNTGFKESRKISKRSVSGKQYGNFLIQIFNEWVRNDVGKMFIQIFDITLGAWVGQPGGLCVFAKTCGNALALEHNGDLYACDHFVIPEEKRGNLMETPIFDLVNSGDQVNFGIKKMRLPKKCEDCSYKFACNGGCPKNRTITIQGEEFKLNHLCDGYKAFFKHVDPYMQFMANELRNRRPAANIMEYLSKKKEI